MPYDKLLQLAEKYAQQVTKVGPSLWDTFKQLPPPDMTKIPGIEQGDGTFEIWASILPGPRIAFDVHAKRLELLKGHDPSNDQIPRLGQVTTALQKILASSYAPKMLAMVKKAATPEEYQTIRDDGLTGEYMLWSLEL
jgi:hypothetical protein